MRGEHTTRLPVVVCGAGVAGITAALDLAHAGIPVCLVEKSGLLGGRVIQLDKLYPTDHCGFCPVRTQSIQCLSHPLISVHLHAAVVSVETVEEDGGKGAPVHRVGILIQPNKIDWNHCVSCGLCQTRCREEAVFPSPAHALPMTYEIRDKLCTGCGCCLESCPAGCIDLARTDVAMDIEAADIIWATGFEDANPSGLPEFSRVDHPRIMTALAFERLIAESGPGKGKILPSEGRAPQRIAFIQCTGARDQRDAAFCSSVCCMHAVKQARWVKRRNPGIDCVIFYTDMRTEGRHYYAYYQAAVKAQSIGLVRGRPGLVCPLPDGSGIGIKFEDTLAGRLGFEKFDLVVLNGGLSPSGSGKAKGKHAPETDSHGFIPQRAGQLSCGFCKEPADVEVSVVQASSAAIAACALLPETAEPWKGSRE